MDRTLTSRARKFIGTFILVAFVTVYALIAMAIGARLLEDAAGWQRFAFYIIAGIAWVIPALPLVRWMQRPDPPLS